MDWKKQQRIKVIKLVAAAGNTTTTNMQVCNFYDFYKKSIADVDLPFLLAQIQKKDQEEEGEVQTELKLWGNKCLGEKSCLHLSKTRLKCLKYITLSFCEVGDRGCYYLRRGDWPYLQELHLSDNNIGEKGCMHLSQIQWRRLTFLNLQYNSIGERGYAMVSLSFWRGMVYCDLQYL